MRLLLAALFAALFAWPALASGPVLDVTNQAWRGIAITPSDTTPIATGPTQAIYTAGTSANAACTMILYFQAAPTVAVTVSFMTPGVAYPFAVSQVGSTGTTCTGIVGLYTPPH